MARADAHIFGNVLSPDFLVLPWAQDQTRTGEGLSLVFAAVVIAVIVII